MTKSERFMLERKYDRERAEANPDVVIPTTPETEILVVLSNANIRSGPGKNHKIIGKLQRPRT